MKQIIITLMLLIATISAQDSFEYYVSGDLIQHGIVNNTGLVSNLIIAGTAALVFKHFTLVKSKDSYSIIHLSFVTYVIGSRWSNNELFNHRGAIKTFAQIYLPTALAYIILYDKIQVNISKDRISLNWQI